MDSPAPTPPSQILGHSTMVRFFRSLVGSKGSPGSSDKALLGGRQCLSREPEAVSLMTDRQGIRGHFAHALERRATGPLEVSPEAFTVEEEECLLGGDLRLASVKVGATPWNHLLTLYKQFQKLTMAKFPLKDGLSHLEEEGEEEDSSFKLCVPGIVTLQSPLHKTFGSTDTVGLVESDLKKLLEVQQESRLWKVGSREGREPLVQPEVALEAASIVGEQEHQAKGEGGRPPAFGECWGPGRRAPRQRKHHPGLEGRVQSPVGVVSSTERERPEEQSQLHSEGVSCAKEEEDEEDEEEFDR
ncbi:gametogenetin-binding protein 1-like [Molossus molossus]|uniref:gametogenetin-binding protein 1-like n=1 Tax=Molossus molossus TaxID=27622 RepID=UPI001747A9DB|nr:gametogenetin-binding protein 1-like [Molossus molossus]